MKQTKREVNFLYFIRGNNEHRMVAVHKDGSYRISASGTFGKLHQNFNQYFHSIKNNGWKQVDHYTYLHQYLHAVYD